MLLSLKDFKKFKKLEVKMNPKKNELRKVKTGRIQKTESALNFYP